MKSKTASWLQNHVDSIVSGAFEDIQEITGDWRNDSKKMYRRFNDEMDKLLDDLSAEDRAYWKGYGDEALKQAYNQGVAAYHNYTPVMSDDESMRSGGEYHGNDLDWGSGWRP